MANRKISDLTALTAPATGDLLPIVDISEAAAADKNKKITIGELFASHPLGTAAAPSVAFEGDSNTGIYSPGADQLAIATGGTGRLFVDASGRVGVGNPVAGYQLSVNGSIYIQGSSTAQIRMQSASGSGSWYYWGENTVADRGVLGYAAGSGDLVYRSGAFDFASGSERLRIDSSGRLLVGTSTARSNFYNSTVTSQTQVEYIGTTFVAGGSYVCNQASIDGAEIVLAKTRSSSIGGTTIVQSGDTAGVVSFQASDGTQFVQCATIRAAIDGTPGADDMPGRLVFSTTADGAASLTERMRITNAGLVGIGTTSPSSKLVVEDSSALKIAVLRTGTAVVGMGVESGPYVYSDGALQFRVGATAGGSADERMRIDTSGRLLVGTSSARAFFGGADTPALQLEGITNTGRELSVTSSTATSQGGVALLAKQRSGAVGGQTIVQSGDQLGYLGFQGSDGTKMLAGASIEATVDGTPGVNDLPTRLVFSTTADGAATPTERMRITNAGIITNKTTNIGATIGTGFSVAAAGYGVFTTSSEVPLYINRETNDGTLIQLMQDNAIEGTISVSGTTVSYNGAHLSRWSQLSSAAERTEILRGSVLSNIDQMCKWGEEANEQLNRMKVSDVEGDKNVSGVFQAWDDDDDTYTDDFYCAMTGDFIIRIAEGVTVQRGDLLMSAGDGTAKPQDDDIIRSKTIAKVTSTHVTCTYEDGSYCVPCVLMAC